MVSRLLVEHRMSAAVSMRGVNEKVARVVSSVAVKRSVGRSTQLNEIPGSIERREVGSARPR